MSRKLHYLAYSSSNMDGEHESASACGYGDTEFEWDGTHKRDQVTCKRCLAALGKPKVTDKSDQARPILFNEHQVRAILSGKLTATRRPVTGDQIPRPSYPEDSRPWVAVGQHDRRYGFIVSGKTEEECARELGCYGACPYGKWFDRLWVRETCSINDYREAAVPEDERPGCQIFYRADGIPDCEGEEDLIRWRSSIHMPRWASRILLEITQVRVERLRDTKDLDLLDDLGDMLEDDHTLSYREFSRIESMQAAGAPLAMLPEMYGYRAWWDKIHGAGSFESNPWVWVVNFKRVEPCSP